MDRFGRVLHLRQRDSLQTIGVQVSRLVILSWSTRPPSLLLPLPPSPITYSVLLSYYC